MSTDFFNYKSNPHVMAVFQHCDAYLDSNIKHLAYLDKDKTTQTKSLSANISTVFLIKNVVKI